MSTLFFTGVHLPHLFDLGKLANIDRDRLARLHFVINTDKFIAVTHLGRLVGRPLVDSGRKGLIGCRQQDQELSVRVLQIALAQTKERRILVDRMNDRPGQREKRYRFALQIEHIEFARYFIVPVLDPGSYHLGLYLDQLIVSPVDDPKHKGRNVLIRSDHGYGAKHDFGSRPRESCEYETCNKSIGKQAVIRFNGDDQVGNDTDRMDRAIADRSKRLNAKEKSRHEETSERSSGRIYQGCGPKNRVDRSED